MRLIQVTLGSGATSITTKHINAAAMTVQNNAAHSVRLGDNTVSATKGILLANGTPGGSYTVQRSDNRIPVYEYFLFGTAADVIDVLYED